MRTVDDVLAALPPAGGAPLPAPLYTGTGEGARVGLAVESMRTHMTDEGWQIFAGLEHAGYDLYGHGLPRPETDVRRVLEGARPSVVLVQDEREWDVAARDFRDPRARFRGVEALRGRPGVLTGTVLKDAQQRPGYHRDSAARMGAHFWVVYYHPRVVARLAPYVRPRHLVRAYHTVDAGLVPPYGPAGRDGALLSGALSAAYPLRQRLVRGLSQLPRTAWLEHPGYHRAKCHTPEFLRTLSRHKVSVCTSSVYGYALRKIIESVACGCVAVTDLPSDEVLPLIDGALVRVRPDIEPRHLGNVLERLYAEYDPERQAHYARAAREWYDFRAAGLRLAQDVEALRRSYGDA